MYLSQWYSILHVDALLRIHERSTGPIGKVDVDARLANHSVQLIRIMIAAVTWSECHELPFLTARVRTECGTNDNRASSSLASGL